MTTTTRTTTPFDISTTPSRTRRWWLALAAGALAVTGGIGALVVADGSDTDRPSATVERVTDDARVGPVSADAVERRAADAATARCSGRSADAVERCMTNAR